MAYQRLFKSNIRFTSISNLTENTCIKNKKFHKKWFQIQRTQIYK